MKSTAPPTQPSADLQPGVPAPATSDALMPQSEPNNKRTSADHASSAKKPTQSPAATLDSVQLTIDGTTPQDQDDGMTPQDQDATLSRDDASTSGRSGRSSRSRSDRASTLSKYNVSALASMLQSKGSHQR